MSVLSGLRCRMVGCGVYDRHFCSDGFGVGVLRPAIFGLQLSFGFMCLEGTLRCRISLLRMLLLLSMLWFSEILAVWRLRLCRRFGGLLIRLSILRCISMIIICAVARLLRLVSAVGLPSIRLLRILSVIVCRLSGLVRADSWCWCRVV